MKSKDFITELRKRKKKEEPIPYDPKTEAYQRLLLYKEDSTGEFPADSMQLFMPRPSANAQTRYQKHLKAISQSFATDDEGELKPHYQQWVDKHPDALDEAAPIIAARGMVPPGNNKPQAILWTSTAKKIDANTYTSDWVEYVSNNHRKLGWMAETGFLYKVVPNATILDLSLDYQAKDIYRVFQALGRGAQAEFDRPAPAATRDSYLYKDFPWGEIAKHFDGVTHRGYGMDNSFLYGWDCESTAWFNPAVLTLLGEVKVGVPPEDYDES